jgi:hypothetical protein
MNIRQLKGPEQMLTVIDNILYIAFIDCFLHCVHEASI